MQSTNNFVSSETGNTRYNRASGVCDTTTMNAMHILKHMEKKCLREIQ